MRVLSHLRRLVPVLLLVSALAPLSCAAQAKKTAAVPDVLVLSDGDTLHGTFVQESGGTITFHTDSLGDVKIGWDKIKSLQVAGDVSVLSSTRRVHGKHAAANIPAGPLEATSAEVTVHPANQPAPAPVAVKNAQVIVSKAELDKQLYHEPNFFTGWNGAATAGTTVVSATENSYAFSGSVGLVRAVPTVPWLDPRNRTSTDFNSSFGKITQPAYTSGGVTTPAVVTKTAILHFDAERDEYFSPRMFALGQTAFDHNYSQDLNLQQIYGGGIGWTALKTPKQEADLKATMQYEKQTFISGSSSANQNLIGSTFSADYLLKLKLGTLTQEVAFIPAYNNARAYSATEDDTFSFPAYKSFSFSIGSLDSYLNDPPATLPPTKRNSFQFTMGLTYAFKSKY
ncbi:MAG TPA: DUF481 domain-containing protein [Acidobacteriaceae bacterium]|jgi:hypothetical protein|nr:DUF481 domain-containing protein [Acidobacteriaceae bacterium]